MTATATITKNNFVIPKMPPIYKDLEKPKKFKILYGGRGSGKSWTVARALLLKGYEMNLRILCLREVMVSIKRSVHTLIAEQVYELGLEDFYTIEADKIYGPTDPKTRERTEFIFMGIKNDPRQVKSTEGVNVCWIEEADNISKESWELLIPTIFGRRSTKSKTRRKAPMNSEIWATFNPEFEEDETYKRFVSDPQYPDDTLLIHSTYIDNPWCPEDQIEIAERMRANDPELYEHVYMGRCRKAVSGAVYEKNVEMAEREGWFRDVPYDKNYPVETFWDIGYGDATAIVVAQRTGQMIQIINFVEKTQESLDYFLTRLRWMEDADGYKIGRHWLPHDSRQHKFGNEWTLEEQFVRKGLNVSVCPNISLSDGINAVRTQFPLMRFDKQKCKILIHHLKRYHYDAKPTMIDGVFRLSEKPVHDESSNAADALRYMAVALQPPKPVVQLKINQPTPRKYGGSFGWMAG